MSIMVELPPAMEQEARGYATVQGTSLEQVFLICLKKELERSRAVNSAMSELRSLAKESHGRLETPYRFNRADAYEPEVPYA